MKTIAIMNQKGGIGKTMTAASIAYLLGDSRLLSGTFTQKVRP